MKAKEYLHEGVVSFERDFTFTVSTLLRATLRTGICITSSYGNSTTVRWVTGALCQTLLKIARPRQPPARPLPKALR